jgi:hypothetical protein
MGLDQGFQIQAELAAETLQIGRDQAGSASFTGHGENIPKFPGSAAWKRKRPDGGRSGSEGSLKSDATFGLFQTGHFTGALARAGRK